MLKRNLHVQIMAVLFLCAPLTAVAADKTHPTRAYLQKLEDLRRERVIVVFRNRPDRHLLGTYNARLIRRLRTLNAFVCEIDRDAVELLKRLPEIKEVVPDAMIRLPRPPRKPTVKLKEKLNAMSQSTGRHTTAQSDIGQAPVEWNCMETGLNARAAWNNYGLDGSGVKIAFIDTGVNYTLPDIDKNYLGGDDFVDSDGDPFTENVSEDHGTLVVSTAVGEGQSQVVGVAPNAGYYALRVLDESGTGLVSDIISALEWAAKQPHKADIISMSLGTDGGGAGWEVLKKQWQNACNAAHEAGIVLVAASGNDGYSYSVWPAAFNNVISAGAHGEDQLVWCDFDGASNGSADLVAPGAHVPAVAPDNSVWWVWGTSFSSPHLAGLVALQLQYARQNNIELNNDYLWEVTRHSAIDLGEDLTYQGKGKAWAARTDANDTNLGAIDLIASHWPIAYDIEFSDYAFAAGPDCNQGDGLFPAYHIGTDVNQSITLTNVTDILGNCPESIENLTVTLTHIYCQDCNEANLPGTDTVVLPAVSLLQPGEVNSITFSLLYHLPLDVEPGLSRTKLELEFNFVGNSRILRVSYSEPDSLCYAAMPGDLNLDNKINLKDFALLAQKWRQTDCNETDSCGRADIDKSGGVDWTDLCILSENWTSNLQ